MYTVAKKKKIIIIITLDDNVFSHCIMITSAQTYTTVKSNTEKLIIQTTRLIIQRLLTVKYNTFHL